MEFLPVKTPDYAGRKKRDEKNLRQLAETFYLATKRINELKQIKPSPARLQNQTGSTL